MSIYINNQQIKSAFYNGKFISTGYFTNNEFFNCDLVILTINPSSDEDVIIEFTNYEVGEIINNKSIKLRKGDNVTYTVSKNDVIIESNTITVNNDQVIDVVIN